MTQNDKQTADKQSPPCVKCQDLTGNALQDDMCAQCYKKQKTLETISLAPTTLLTPPPASHPHDSPRKQEEISKKRERPSQKARSPVKGKCNKCSKRTGLLGFDCKHCHRQFCKLHRLTEDHNCQVDYVTLGRKQIKLANPNVKIKKIEDI